MHDDHLETFKHHFYITVWIFLNVYENNDVQNLHFMQDPFPIWTLWSEMNILINLDDPWLQIIC